MEGTAVVIGLIIIVLGSLYLYNDYKTKLPPQENGGSSDSTSDKNFGTGIIKPILKYGCCGALISGIGAAVLRVLFNVTDIQGFIVLTAIIISTVICSCTGIIVHTLRLMK